MTGSPRSRRRDDRNLFNKYLSAFAVAASAVLFGALLSKLFGEAHLNADTRSGNQAVSAGLRDRKEEYTNELRLYVWGFALALVLTLVPFGLVNWSVISPFALLIVIGIFALIQVMVHFRCFLHINPPKQNTDDLHLILFSSLLLFFMVGGTIWIMANLAMRMH